jgi:hypothetical protein
MWKSFRLALDLKAKKEAVPSSKKSSTAMSRNYP